MSDSSVNGKQQARVLSGMRPTGKLHLGHFSGVVENWVRLQRQYECFFFVADWHALTTDYADSSQVKQNSLEMAFDWLACGLDPERSTLFIQSHVIEHAELHLLLSLITPLGWLERVPTYKEQRENIKDKDLGTYGFLGYPVLQAADILIYQADYVPVGEDQVPHVELTREIARRFNQFYRLPEPKRVFGLNPAPLNPQAAPESKLQHYETCAVLPEPQPLLTPAAKLPGTDGRKMSKSYGNAILLTDPAPLVRQKLKTMVTDPARVRRTDPGNPEICPAGDLHKIFSTPATIEKVWPGCQTAGIGCIECKGWLADHIVEVLAPIQDRRRHYENHPKLTWDILEAGSARAQAMAAATMDEVRLAMRLSHRYEAPAPAGGNG
jgi:tryptophanyl-tRNA synthetase